ncbi:MAG: bifunctional acetate--CoA ligase family protein/GNAT family N-acetyltransferase [Hyphomicrobiaceae bacterium]|nr:bifunctional acetate--CoA ligase family protein/GNAT family N-acetyltransferase [Hyphomicrobiaceae bacterium]
MTIRNLDHMFQPRSVVLIGASSKTGSVGNWLARNLVQGFDGKIDFVNPKGGMMAGHAFHKRLSGVASPADLAVIVTPPETVPGIITELGQAGTRAAVVITAGIKDDLRQAMLDASKPHCLRLLGPNCIGLMLPHHGLNASFSHIAAPKGDLAFLSQSGALITGIVDWAAARGIGFSQVVSLGDMADVDFGDLLYYLADDPKSRAILIYMEALTHARKFMSAARRAARSKPVIVIKSGRHAAGARAASSHTGALAGLDAAYDAAFRRAGLLRVEELSELFGAAEMLSKIPQISGERLAVITNGGGAGVMAVDRLADLAGTLAEISPETIAQLDAVLPPTWSRDNPIDIIGDAPPERYAAALEAVFADSATDAVLVINCPTAITSSTEAARSVVAARDAAARSHRRIKPVLTNWLGETSAQDARQMFSAAGIPSFETPGEAIHGYMQLVAYARAQEQLMRAPPSQSAGHAPNRDAARHVIRTALDAGRTMLSEAESKALLLAYRIPTVATHVARNLEGVRSAAAAIISQGQRVVVKILSDDISHKSDVGGVALDIDTVEDAVATAHQMRERISRRHPKARIEGFTIQAMIARRNAHELIIGMSEDHTFGPLVMFGAGGTAVEVERDTALALPPLDLKLARELMSQTRVSRLLAGYRDRPPAAMDAIAETLVKVSQLVSNHAEIRELDINPLIADETGVIALDARVVIANEAANPRRPMALRPYPVEWERLIGLPTLGGVLIRPIRPEDEHLYSAFFDRVDANDTRLRFFSQVQTRSHAFLARLTQVDYAREIAFVAVSEVNELLGVARFATDPDYERAEYAVLVRSDLKGRGLGRALMLHLLAYARAEGLKEVSGFVLAENTGMLKLAEELGFASGWVDGDPAMRRVVLPLVAADAKAAGSET